LFPERACLGKVIIFISQEEKVSNSKKLCRFFLFSGVFAMIDDGETDWKVVTISMDDERAPQVSIRKRISIYASIYAFTHPFVLN
jgi:inorganic pyrophosphatase